MQKMNTPHNTAHPGQIAKTVLMPGDPLRAKFIAENYFEDAELVNNARGVQGYTGRYKDTPVTVMASGMGIPSIGIYSWELYSFYDVDNIIRIGSAGALQDELQLMDIVMAQGACTNSNYIKSFVPKGSFAPIADFELLTTAYGIAREHGVDPKVGNLLSADNFYTPDTGVNDMWKSMGVLAIEMEAAGLYANAAALGKRALAICTVSDHIYREEALSAEQRQTSFRQMMEIALDTAVAMAEKAKK